MDKEKIIEILNNYKNNKISINQAIDNFKKFPFENIDFAVIDTHRALRKGFPEVIFCQGKTSEQVLEIVKRQKINHKTIIATRADKIIYEKINKLFNDSCYFEKPKIVLIGEKQKIYSEKKIIVISAGTSDIPVAEEAAVCLEIFGCKIERLYDIGVAGIHRLFNNIEKLFTSEIIIVVAGMDGALPSIIGGIVDKPVIAVPTSVGYGASFEGLSALLTMLNSCAPGITTVNIDNGFGAGYFANLLLKRIEDK